MVKGCSNPTHKTTNFFCKVNASSVLHILKKRRVFLVEVKRPIMLSLVNCYDMYSCT